MADESIPVSEIQDAPSADPTTSPAPTETETASEPVSDAPAEAVKAEDEPVAPEAEPAAPLDGGSSTESASADTDTSSTTASSEGSETPADEAHVAEAPAESGETTSTEPPVNASAPLTGEPTVAAETSAEDAPAVLSGSAVDAPKEESEVADADKGTEDAGEGKLGDDVPMPAIADQPSAEDAAAQRPLSAQATDPATPAVDAVPDEAQQHMAQWQVSDDPQAPSGAGQLPNASELPGTPDDATAIAGDITPQVVASAKPNPVSDDADESDSELSDDEGADDETDGDDVELGDDDELSDADDGIFGDTKAEHGPLADLAGDGFDSVKSAAEIAYKAQDELKQVPVMLLELEHKELLFEMRDVLYKFANLAERLFHRR